MSESRARFAGVELYFEDLGRAREFYRDALGLALEGDVPDHHAKFGVGTVFLCAEKKGVEDYPSADKAVVFLEVPDFDKRLSRIDRTAIVGSGSRGGRAWAAIRDPEEHTIMLIEQGQER